MADNQMIFDTAWGWMGLAASEQGISTLVLPRASRRAVEREWSSDDSPVTSEQASSAAAALLRIAHRQVLDYLAGTRQELDFPLDLSASTPFQRKVWRMAQRIPFGRVRSYGWVAERVGGTQYARAVGNALGANPVPLIVPCHRVVAHDGSLGGFSGGLPVKRKLLQLEGTWTQLKAGVRAR